MTPQFYARAHGWLYTLDLRVKLLLSIVSIALCAAWGNWIFLSAMLVALLVMCLSSHVPAGRMVRLWAYLGPACLLVFAVMIASMNGYGTQELWRLGWWRVTAQTLAMCGVVVLRIADITLAAFLTLFTTSHARWVSGLRALGLPLPAARAAARAVRFVPSFAALVSQRVRMRAVRGAHTGPLGWCAAVADAARHMRADMLDMQVACRTRAVRADIGSARRTLMHPARMRVSDWIALLVVVLFAALVVVMMSFGW